MNDKLSPEVDQLVDAAKEGDCAAHSEICRQVQGQLNRMADRHLDAKLRRKLNPSDIVQATLTRMVQGFGDFRGSSSAEFYGWLNQILKNEVFSTRRDLQRRRLRCDAPFTVGVLSEVDLDGASQLNTEQWLLLSTSMKILERGLEDGEPACESHRKVISSLLELFRDSTA